MFQIAKYDLQLGAGRMLSGYEDIFALAKRLDEKPRWFDEHGVPRFCDHHPHYCPDIYARVVALVLISCQRCGSEFRVQLSNHTIKSFADDVRNGTIHYGDPPTHDVDGEFCHAGCTMNCYDLRVLEFWCRSGSDWERDVSLEIDLPDMHDEERLR